MTMVLHRGGWEATPADLASVPVPDDTDTWKAVPYPRLIEEVNLHVPRFGLTVTRAEYALAREGRQMFGVLTCTNGNAESRWALAIGLRTSYDRSLATELVAGTRVFCCDNLAFHGEASVSRKHTANVFRDLPDLIYRMLSSVSAMKQRMAEDIHQMEIRHLDEPIAHHLMVEAIRRGVLPASRLPKVIEAWDSPQHEEFKPRNAWSLFNAFTEVAKARSPADQMDSTLRLTQVFREGLALSTN